MVIQETSRRKVIILVVIVIILILAAVFVVAKYFKKTTSSLSSTIASQENTDYVIPGVPYAGMHNHKGGYSYLESPISQPIASVMDYWYPDENNYSEIYRFFVSSGTNRFIGAGRVSDIFTKYGKYGVKTEHLQLNELDKYINANSRTPLLVFLSVDSSQPKEIIFHPLTLVIGVKESGQKLVIHDVYFGNNFEMSFDEFNKRMEQMRPDERNTFLAVQPVDLDEKLKEIKKRNPSDYSPRTLVMQKTENIFKNFAMGAGAMRAGQTDFAVNFLSAARKDANYEEYFPPALKAYLTAYLADMYLMKKDFDSALLYANESVSLNHDLDKPFKDWPGWEARSTQPEITDQIRDPYRVLGDVYLAKKDFQRAKENFEKTLSLNPGDEKAIEGLKVVKIELAK